MVFGSLPSMLSLVAISILASGEASAAVTKNQLGQMILGTSSVVITQDYLAYYKDGPTSATTKGGYHPGIDYRAKQPVPLYSPLDGVVESVGGSYGTLAIKKNGSDTRIIIMHMSEFWVKKGDKVQTGCALGKSGTKGTGAYHVHVEARVNKNNGAYYFKSKTDTGSNKSPELIPPSYKAVMASTPCKQ